MEFSSLVSNVTTLLISYIYECLPITFLKTQGGGESSRAGKFDARREAARGDIYAAGGTLLPPVFLLIDGPLLGFVDPT